MDSLLRFNIANQYNLFHYQMINLSLINKISEEQKIPLKELMNLLDISYSSRKKFENQIDTNAYIKIYSIEELKEIEREIVQEVLKFPQMNEERMLFLEQKYRITRSILKKILKISNNTYYRKIRNGKIVELKFENKKTAIKLDKTLKTKEKIKKIQLDLKYLKNYGRRFYSKQELDLMSYTYKIDVHELLLYLAHNRILYEVYEDAYENNPQGVWLGEKCELSNEFVEKNYEILDKYMEKISMKICSTYRNFSDKDDLKSEIWEEMLKTSGVFEKNIINEEKLIFYLKIPILFKMKKTYLDMPRYNKLYYINKDGVEYERTDISCQSDYTPGIDDWCFEVFDYIKDVEDIHVQIIREIKYNLNFVSEYPKNFYNRLAYKYKLSMQRLEEIMGEIRVLIEKNNLIKYDKNGYVLPMFYVESE